MYRISVLLLACGLINYVSGQGRLLDPPGRGSMWRVGYDTPVNYDDNVLNCGGLQRRWEVNNGKCGVCGDPWDLKPREHELGGKYATGTISKAYKPGSIIEILVEIPNTHNGGFFEVQICDLTNSRKEATESCFNEIVLTLKDSASTRYYDLVPGENKVSFVLPANLLCQHCVLRWKYRTGDHFGCETDVHTNQEVCGFGRGNFYNEYFACSDISITSTPTIDTPTSPLENEKYNFQTTSFNHTLSRKKRTVHVNFPKQPASRSRITPYIPLSENQNFRNLPFTRLGRPTTETRRIQWAWSERRGGTTRARQDFKPPTNNVAIQTSEPIRLPSRNFPNVDINRLEIGQGEMFPGSMPVPAMVRVERPVVRQIIRSRNAGTGLSVTSPIFRQIDTSQIRNNFLEPLNADFGPKMSVSTINQHVFSKHRIATKKCIACPFDQCLDKTMELDTIFPGLFEKPAEFLECKKYQKLFSLGKYKLLSEGLPACSHPRFKRQLRTIPRKDEDDFGCCGTRPQVVLPLTVESDRESYNVVQLPNERNQFLVQGICGHDNTTTCSSCVAENNFQWVLVYDPRVNTSPPVSFVPVKFPHYCRCLNPGRRFVG